MNKLNKKNIFSVSFFVFLVFLFINFQNFVFSPFTDMQEIHNQNPPTDFKDLNIAGGNSVTWDGKILIEAHGLKSKPGSGWFARVFNPNKFLKDDIGGYNLAGSFSKQTFPVLAISSEKYPNGVFKSHGLPENYFQNNETGHPFFADSNGKTSAILADLNAISVVPAESTNPADNNPYFSDSDGNRPGSSDFKLEANETETTYQTYDLIIYTTTSPFSSPKMGFLKMKIVVKSPNTDKAMIHKSILTKDFQVILTKSLRYVDGIEPTVTLDGKLLIFHDYGIMYYIYNQNKSVMRTTNQWSEPQVLSHLHFEKDTLIDGLTIAERYPLAREQLRSNLGEPYADRQVIKGAYPWINPEGSELFFEPSTGFYRDPTNRAQRAGTSVIGRWTGYKTRMIDNFLNQDIRGSERPRTFTVGIANTGSIWNPFVKFKKPAFPAGFEKSAYLILELTNGRSAEIGFRDLVDGRYVLSLAMNPALKKEISVINKTPEDNIDFNHTPDLSANDFLATLHNQAGFPIEAFAGEPADSWDTKKLIGVKGQAISFKAQSYIQVGHKDALNESSSGMSAEIFVKLTGKNLREYNLSNPFLKLINKTGSYSLNLEKNHDLQLRLVIAGEQISLARVATNITKDKWSHIAFTHDPNTGKVRFFLNGRVINEQIIKTGVISNSNNDLEIGPNGSASGSDLKSTAENIVILDELKISNLVRSSIEIADSSFLPYSQRIIRNSNDQSGKDTLSPPANLYSLSQVRHAEEEAINIKQAKLGQTLFHDQRLSVRNNVSCASCHNLDRAFTDSRGTSIGTDGSALPRSAPVVFNRLFSEVQMWDGKFTSLEAQAGGPITNVHEMGMKNLDELVHKLNRIPSYASAFKDVYKQDKNPLSKENIVNALTSYQSILVAAKSNADDETLLEPEALRGKALFFGKARCIACHSGSNFSDEQFHNNGLTPNSSDRGRYEFTHNQSDLRAFKTPSLRNVSKTAPYMHDGSIADLAEVVDLYNQGGNTRAGKLDESKSGEIRPLHLSGSEKNDLIAYLHALDSEIVPLFAGFSMVPSTIETLYPFTQAINAVCGAANSTYVSNRPSVDESCEQGNRGTISQLPQKNWTWQCKGMNGGKDVSCTSKVHPPVVGVCGSANRAAVNGKPILPAELCQAGEATNAVQNAAQGWQWSCKGQYSGANASCSTADPNKFEVAVGKSLLPGQFFGNSQVRLAYQPDGNLVIYTDFSTPKWRPLWASNTTGKSCTADNCKASFQKDGNLVLYVTKPNFTPYWESHTANGGPGDIEIPQHVRKLVISTTAPHLYFLDENGQFVTGK